MALLKGLGFDELDGPPPTTAPVAPVKGKAKAPATVTLTAAQKREVEDRAAKLAVLLECVRVPRPFPVCQPRPRD
jgi:hypothetical protein